MERELLKLLKLVKAGRTELILKTDGKCFLCIGDSILKLDLQRPSRNPSGEPVLEEFPFSLNELCFLLNLSISEVMMKNVKEKNWPILNKPVVKAVICEICKGPGEMIVRGLRKSLEAEKKVWEMMEGYQWEKKFKEMMIAADLKGKAAKEASAVKVDEGAKEVQTEKPPANPPLRVGRSRVARKVKKRTSKTGLGDAVQ